MSRDTSNSQESLLEYGMTEDEIRVWNRSIPDGPLKTLKTPAGLDRKTIAQGPMPKREGPAHRRIRCALSHRLETHHGSGSPVRSLPNSRSWRFQTPHLDNFDEGRRGENRYGPFRSIEGSNPSPSVGR
jgi:hypothetical protein